MTENSLLPAAGVERYAYWLNKDVLRAIRDYQMIAPGERVLAAVSGGKDSLALLSLLDRIRRNTLVRFDLVAVHVQGDALGADAPLSETLAGWLGSTGIEYHIRRMHLKDDESLPMNCHRCSRSRRRTLFEAAEELGCRTIALGHHADDLAQSALMNFLFNGRLEGMAPSRLFFDGKMRVIRPLIYLRERDIRRFAQISGFPQERDRCPLSGASQRTYTAELLRKLEKDNPKVFGNLARLGLAHTVSEER